MEYYTTVSNICLIKLDCTSNAVEKGLLWTSENPDIAKVDSTGTITCLKAGTASILAKSKDGSSVETSIEFDVIEKPKLVTSISLYLPADTYYVGDSDKIIE